MYFCDEGIVLKHRDYSEYNRLVSVFTRNNGRIEINFKGVNKSHSKLKALTEMFCLCDYRLYQRKYGAIVLCIGGNLITSFPGIRNNLGKIFAASFVTDTVMAMTPYNHPMPEKYNFIINAFNYINSTDKLNKWFFIIFMMNMLEFHGLGFNQTNIGYDSELWKLIHIKDFSGVDFSFFSIFEKYYVELYEFALSKIREHTGKELKLLETVLT